MSLLLNNLIFENDEKNNINNVNYLILEKELTEEDIEEESSSIYLYKMKQQYINNKISIINLTSKKKKKIAALRTLSNNTFLKKNSKLLTKRKRPLKIKIINKIKSKPLKKKIYHKKKKQYFYKKDIYYSSINKNYFDNFIISYVIHISIIKKNTNIYVTDTKGQLKLNYSASTSLKLTGKQKTFQPKVLIELLKLFLKKLYVLKLNKKHYKKIPIALCLKYIPKNYFYLITNRLRKKVKIITINYANFYPHNGCRPKKIKRLKRRKNQQNKKFYFKGKPFSSFQKPIKKNKFYENL